MPSSDLDQPTALPPSRTPDDDPLLRLQEEMEPEFEVELCCTTHPEPLAITGIPIMCPQCGARRDWMVICYHAQVSIRCRCAHQWHEPELTRADFETMIATGGTDYPDLEAAAQAIGYDGTLAGTYLDSPR